MFKYEVGIIDHMFGCVPFSEYVKSGIPDSDITRAVEIIANAMPNFRNWDGDIRSIHVFAVPSEITAEVGFMIGQENNGTTFAISPVELPHLQEFMDTSSLNVR